MSNQVALSNNHIDMSSEAAALEDILEWSQECPLWQRDALRRLCLHNELVETDIEELFDLCKANSSNAVPLATGHLPDPKAATANIRLQAIHKVKNVNALAEDERLTFCKVGLTVIYGDNGSGKSGYVRILKEVCRARSPKNDSILPNIYSDTTAPKTSVIDFSENGQNKSITWSDDHAPDPLLSSVSIFDTRTASVHVDQENDVAYTPFPLKVLRDLARSCQLIKQKLNDEIKALEQKTPATISRPECQPSTEVGKLIDGLSSKTKFDYVQGLAKLSKDQKARLDTLNEDLSRDPIRTARQIQSRAARLRDHNNRLEKLFSVATQDKAEALSELFGKYQTAKSAAQVASEKLFSNEPLPDIGSDVWRALWEAARKYSKDHVYKDEPFPFTETSARCVLCQQELDEEAVERLNRFEAFVKDKSKKKEEAARISHQVSVTDITERRYRVSKLRALIKLIRDEVGNESLADQVRKSALVAMWRLRHIIRYHTSPALFPLPPGHLERLPHQELEAKCSDLDNRAASLLAEGESEERKQLLAEKNELSDKKWLASVKDDVLDEIKRKAKIADLQAAIRDTSTNRITTKSTEVAKALVTNTLRAQFTQEVASLGVEDLEVELRQEKTSYAVPSFRVSLIRKPEVPVGNILSEGEHRCVALAAFFSELATTKSHSAIVFDDPVSSLDHMHREAVASKLVSEGNNRQVIVFTHDIVFLHLLNRSCRESRTPITSRSISRGPEFTGLCRNDFPLKAQPVDSAITTMKDKLDNQKIQHKNGDQDAWYLTVHSLQEQLRTTWERAVEETLSPVIKRFSDKVDTKGLPKVTAITLDHCKEMRKAYGRCSASLHSSSEAVNNPLPTPDVIRDEINKLHDWISDIKERQADIYKKQKKIDSD